MMAVLDLVALATVQMFAIPLANACVHLIVLVNSVDQMAVAVHVELVLLLFSARMDNAEHPVYQTVLAELAVPTVVVDYAVVKLAQQIHAIPWFATTPMHIVT